MDAAVEKLFTTVRRAKARLTRMVTQEVSLVDRGANGWNYLIVKNGEDMDANVKKLALKLPADAKKAIMDGLAASLDKISAVAAMVGEAETDDTAQVPDELAIALKEIGTEITAIGTAHATAAPADGTAEQDSPEQTPPAPSPEADKAAAPPPVVAPPPADVAKSLLGPQTDTLSLSTKMTDLVMSPKTASAASAFMSGLGEDMGKASMEMLTGVEKAGRKIASGRFKKLEELHGGLGKLLNELAWDESGPEASSEKPAAKAVVAPVAKAATKTKSTGADQALRNLTKLLERNAETPVAKSEGRTPVTNVRPVDGGGAQSVTWPLDLSAELAERAQQQKKNRR